MEKLMSAEIEFMETSTLSTLKYVSWEIEGIKREAYVHFPTGLVVEDAPLIVAFHGHGGQALGFGNKQKLESYWPKAIVVYPQGLPTVSGLDKMGVNSGWQHSVGEVNLHTQVKDQDLKFWDAIIERYADNTNPDLIFPHGWSNGGEFLYDVLWVKRGAQLRALSCAASILNTVTDKNTLPHLHICGTADPVVPFNRQQESIHEVALFDQCNMAKPSQWATGDFGLLGKKYWSKIKDHVISLQYDGGHAYPDNVPPLIVRFFRQITLNIG